MTTYGRPGVFVQENFNPLSAGGQGIPGEALPAFTGVYPRGPLAPTLVTSWQQYVQLFGDFTVDPGNLLPFAVYEFFANGGFQTYILRLPNVDASDATLVLQDVDSPDPNNVLTVSANSPGDWGQNVYVEVATAGQSGRFNFNVYYNGSTSAFLVETFQDLSMDPTDRRNANVMLNSPISGSNYVSVEVTFPNDTYVSGQNDLALITPTALSGGGDGSTPPDLTVAVPTGLDQLINQVLYINIPGEDDTTILTTLLNWAATDGDKTFIIDGPSPNLPETNADVAANYLNMVSGGSALPQSTYGNVYGPWALIQDPSSTVPGATRYVPLGGLVMAKYNAADTQVGSWQSPAGITYGVLNVIDLETRFTNAQLDSLNIAQVNAAKLVPGVGFCVFGARTLHPGYPDRYVAVRRMIIKLEHDFEYLLQYALFLPNDKALWKNITLTLTTYLNQLLQIGALGGTSPADSFSVICDDTINTPATATAGIVNVNVAVSLLSPAEFIEIQLSQFQGTATTTVTTTTS